MNNDSAKYTWQGFFRYSAHVAGGSPTWRYHLKDNWKLESSEYLGWNFKERAKDLLAHRESLQLAITSVCDGNLPTPDFLKWLANPSDVSPPVTQGVAVMLNHIVAAGRVEPFKILATFVYKHLMIEIKKLPAGSPCWFYLNLPHELTYLDEYLLMLPEWFYEIVRLDDSPTDPSSQGKKFKIDKVKTNKELELVLKKLKSVRILHEYSVLLYQHDKESLEISLRDEVTIVPYPKGRICHALPIPGKTSTEKWKASEPVSVLTPEVVVVSPNVCACLESLTRIWQDRFAKSVLISAPPGSGKEAYAGSIPYGSGRATDQLISIPLTSGDTASLERQLFGRRREDGSIEEGLICKAAKTAIFLDEVHQPEEGVGIRASLLRPLESDEYFPSDSSKVERVDNVLFVLATSKSLEALGKIRPIDFWTRMTHVVAIKHPLDYNQTKANVPPWREVLQCFFKCFWWDRLEKFYKIDPSRIEGDSEHAATWLKEGQVKQLLDEDALDSISGRFAERLLAKLKYKQLKPKDFSVRGIRSVVSRMFSMGASDIARGESASWRENFYDSLDSVIDEIILVSLLGEVKPKRAIPGKRRSEASKKRTRTKP